MREQCAARWRIFLTGLLVGLGVFAVAAQPVFSGDGQPASSGQALATAGASADHPRAEVPGVVPGGPPGMIIYVDPQTGAILREPAAGTVPLQLNPQLVNSLSTSHQGLVETPSSVAGGGVKLDLQGRFQSPLFATVDANGKVTLQHLGETPGVVDRP